MLRRCWMVVSSTGSESVFIHAVHERAVDYAAKVHGHIVPMMGQDHVIRNTENDPSVIDLPESPVALETIEDVPL